MTTKSPDLVVAKYDYQAADSHELGIYKGERLTLLDDTQHWWRVMNAQGRIGYVPSNYVKRSKQGIFSSLRNTLRHRKSRHEGPGISVSGSVSARPSKPSSPAPDEDTTATAPTGHMQLHTPVSNGSVTLPAVSGRHYAGSVDSIGFTALLPMSITPSQSLQQQRWDQKGSSSGDVGASFTAPLPPSVQQTPRLPHQPDLDYVPAYDDNPSWNNRSPVLSKQNAAWLSNNGEQANPFPEPKPLHIKQNGHHYPEETSRLVFPSGGQQYNTPAPGVIAAASQSPHMRYQQVCSALFSYTASQPDELSITRGDRIAVLEQSSDGWWRGVLLTEDDSGRSTVSGWFPSNYVTTTDLTSLSADSGVILQATSLNCSSMAARRPTDTSHVQAALPQPNRFATPARPNMTAASSASTMGGVCAGITERVLTLYPFVRNQEEEMSFDANEVLEVIDKPPDDPEWWRCRNSVGQTGLVPRNYVRVLSPNPAVPANQHRLPAVVYQQQQQSQPGLVTENPTHHHQREHQQRRRLHYALQSKGSRTNVDRVWYWGAISRAECEAMLAQYSMPGEFVIRDSESHPGDLTVTINAGSRARNFKVHFDRGDYHIGQKVFPSLDDLIEHYRHHPIFKSDQEKHYLTRPFIYPGDHCTTSGSLGNAPQELANFPVVSTSAGIVNSQTLSSRCN